MPDEIYDVFDEQGNKTGTATWTEVHTKGLLHRGVSVLIFKDESRKETLIQKRSLKMVQHPGLWQHAAGGHVLAGESVDEGVLKELQEELFWDHPLPKLSLRKIVTFFNHDMPMNREFLALYETVYPGPFFFSPKEVAEPPQWVVWGELMKDIARAPEKYQPAFKTIVKVYTAPDQYRTGPQF